MAIEVGSAVVAVFPSVKGFGKELSKQLSPELAATGKDLSRSLGDGMAGTADAEGKKVGAQMSKSMGSALKVDLDKTMTNILKGVGAVGAGILGTALFKGFGRLKDIDNAKAKLDGLGHSGESVAKIMDNALAAVKGTAFGLGEAASLAATITASGVKEGKDLERVLKLVADSATIGGSSLTEMGAIWAKVAATGRLQGDELNQLTSQGIPILQMLADHYGITAAAAQDMVTKGKVNFDDFAAAMESKLGGAAKKSGQTFEGALANMGAALGRLGASLLGTTFEDLTTTFGDLTDKLDELGPAAKRFGDALAAVAGFAKDNATWLIPLVSSIVAMAAAYKAATFAAAAYALVMALVNAGSFAAMLSVLKLNVAVLAFPGTWIVLAIAGIAAALIALWNTNEGFRDAVTGAWEAVKNAASVAFGAVRDIAVGAWSAIQNAWSNVTGFFSGAWDGLSTETTSAWDNVKATVSNAAGSVRDVVSSQFTIASEVAGRVWGWLWDRIKAVWDNFGWPVFVTIRAAVLLVAWGFEIMAEGIVNSWNYWVNIAKTVWAAVGVPLVAAITVAAKWLADKTVEMKDVVVAAWNALVAGARRAYDTIMVPLQAAFTATMQALATMGNWLRDQIIAAWNAFAAGMQAVYRAVIVPLWEAFKAAINVVVAVFVAAKNALSAAWQAVVDKLAAGWAWIRDKVFAPLRDAVAAIPGYFERARDLIASAWEKVRATVAKPVEFVVNTVIRDGIVEAWNKVAEKLMLPKWDFKGVSFGYATGGWTGPGSKYTPAGVVHADEFVIRKESQQSLARSYPGLLDYLNTHGAMPGYAGGGRVYEYMWAWARKHLPGMQLTSSYRPGSNDFHGQGKAIDLAAPMTPSGQAAMLAAAKTIYATFGANILELIHTPLGAKGQLKRGRPIDYGAATLAQHVNHVHWAMETFNEAMAGAPALTDVGLDLSPVGSILKTLLGGPLGLASKGIGKLGGMFGDSDWIKMVTAFAQKPFDEVKKFLEGKIDELFPSFSSSGAYDGLGADSWIDTVKQALKITGQDEKYTETLLRRMQQESGGNPRAINNSDANAAAGTPSKGLMQVIDPTFRAYAMPGYNTDIYDPLSNIIASIRYAIDRYGNLSAAYSRPGGYALGGLVSPTLYDQGGYLPPGLTLAANLTGRPERILTAEQDAARSGGHTYVINTVDRDRVDDLVREIEYATRVSTLTRRYR